MCLLPLEGLPLSHFSETIRVGWAVGNTMCADVKCVETRFSPYQVGRWSCWWPASSSHTSATKGMPAVQWGLSRLALGRVMMLMPFPTVVFNLRVDGRAGCGLGEGGQNKVLHGSRTQRLLLGNKGNGGTCYIALSGGFSEQPRASTRDAHTRFHPSHQSSVLSNECFTSDYLERVWSCQRQDNLREFSCNPLGEVGCFPKRLWWVPHHPQVLRDLYRCFSVGPWEASLFLNIPHRLRICLRRCCWLVQADELLWGPAGISHDTCWWGWRRQRRGKYSFQTHWEVWEEHNESCFPTI